LNKNFEIGFARPASTKRRRRGLSKVRGPDEDFHGLKIPHPGASRHPLPVGEGAISCGTKQGAYSFSPGLLGQSASFARRVPTHKRPLPRFQSQCRIRSIMFQVVGTGSRVLQEGHETDHYSDTCGQQGQCRGLYEEDQRTPRKALAVTAGLTGVGSVGLVSSEASGPKTQNSQRKT
jgi:hypothetical protein